MSSRLLNCKKNGLIKLPKSVEDSNCLVYECIMGSIAYGCATDTSDEDIYGIAIPPKHYIFSHLKGIIPGFGQNPYVFEEFMQHHVEDTGAEKKYDFTIFNIIKYFNLLYGCNPNIIDSIFVPQNCITHITQIGQLLRDNRHMFLSKLCIPKLRGYAISQFKKMENKEPVGKRLATVEKYGFDVKFASHTLRLLFQAEQILLEKDLDLTRNSQTLLAIKTGKWSMEKVKDIFDAKDKEIESLVLKSDLPAKPDESKVRDLLLECLEMHYGKISDKVIVEDSAKIALRQIAEIAEKYSK